MLVFDLDNNPLFIDLAHTAKIGEIGYSERKIMEKTSYFQVYIKPIVLHTNEIPKELLTKINNKEITVGYELTDDDYLNYKLR